MQTKRSNQGHIVIMTIVRSIASVARSFLPVEFQRELHAECLVLFVEIADSVNLHGDLLEIAAREKIVEKSAHSRAQ